MTARSSCWVMSSEPKPQLTVGEADVERRLLAAPERPPRSAVRRHRLRCVPVHIERCGHEKLHRFLLLDSGCALALACVKRLEELAVVTRSGIAKMASTTPARPPRAWRGTGHHRLLSCMAAKSSSPAIGRRRCAGCAASLSLIRTHPQGKITKPMPSGASSTRSVSARPIRRTCSLVLEHPTRRVEHRRRHVKASRRSASEAREEAALHVPTDIHVEKAAPIIVMLLGRWTRTVAHPLRHHQVALPKRIRQSQPPLERSSARDLSRTPRRHIRGQRDASASARSPVEVSTTVPSRAPRTPQQGRPKPELRRLITATSVM